ncbi:MAG: HAD family hydrolase [Cellulosilyticaceae bacterium]
MKDLVIFDIDGTLLNSVKFNVKALNYSLEMLGYEHRVSEEVVKQYLGCTGEVFYKGVLSEECELDWERIREYNRAHNGEIMLKYGKAFDGVKETFIALKERGIKIALYSNCSRMYMDRAMQLMGVEEWVDYHECVKDCGIEKPQLIHKILEYFDTKNAVVVGDRIHDYEAAIANGIGCVGVMYGYGKKEMTACRYKLYNMRELMALLREIG